MNFSLTSKRNTIVAVVVALLTLLFGGIIYLAMINPSWSPIPYFRGDGQGTSDAQKRQQEASQEKKLAEERLAGSLQFLPQNAILITHANLSAVEGGQEWWTNYGNMLPPHYDIPQTIPEELNVSSLTYGVFTTKSTEYAQENPFAYALVVSVPENVGEQALAYFGENVNANFFNHYATVEDTAYIILAETYLYDDIATLVRGENPEESFAALERNDQFAVDAPSPTMFVSFSDYFNTLAAYKPDKTGFMDSFMNDGIGMADDTIWLGTSEDHGVSWVGEFLTGGVDRDKIDTEKFEQTLTSEIELIYAENPIISNDGSVILDYGYALPGMSALGEAISISAGSHTVGEVVNPHDGSATPVRAEAETEEVIIVFSPQMMQGAFQSALKPSSVKTVTIRVKEGNSTIEFTYYKDSDFAVTEVPEPTEEPVTE